MATPAQLAANQANARKSTGPRSVEGKSASRFNALKHGADAQLPVIPGEDPAEYQTLAAEYRQRFQPENPDELYHVQTMIDSVWQKRRLQLLETQLYEILDTEAPGMSLAAAILAATPAAKLLARTQRQLAAHQRAWYRAFTELRRQREREQAFEEQPYEPYISPYDDAPELLPEDRVNPANQFAGTNPISLLSQPPAPPQSTEKCDHIDENTGQFRYFVG